MHGVSGDDELSASQSCFSLGVAVFRIGSFLSLEVYAEPGTPVLDLRLYVLLSMGRGWIWYLGYYLSESQ